MGVRYLTPHPLPRYLMTTARNGLVHGGEAIKGVHELVETMADYRVRSQATRQGRLLGGMRSAVIGQIRRCLSVTTVQANTMCLLDNCRRWCGGSGRPMGEGREEVNMRRGSFCPK